jgi:hypothetical protein
MEGRTLVQIPSSEVDATEPDFTNFEAEYHLMELKQKYELRQLHERNNEYGE